MHNIKDALNDEECSQTHPDPQEQRPASSYSLVHDLVRRADSIDYLISTRNEDRETVPRSWPDQTLREVH